MATQITQSDISSLYDAVLKMKDRSDCQKFLRDICTLKEVEIMAERWKIVRLLEEQKTYRQIAEETGCSTTLVTRVAFWLHHGKGGYRLVLNRMKA